MFYFVLLFDLDGIFFFILFIKWFYNRCFLLENFIGKMWKGGGGIFLVIFLCLYFNFGLLFFLRRCYRGKLNLWFFFGIYVKGFVVVILGEIWVNFFLIRCFFFFLGVFGLYGVYRKLIWWEFFSKGYMNFVVINIFDVNSLELMFIFINVVL